MDFLQRLLRRFASFFQAKPLDNELEAEMAAHLEFAIEENLRRGMSPGEARRQAMASFGGMQQARERHREARSFSIFSILWQDFRYATRKASNSPGFTLTAVLVLALGIGVNVAAFTAFDVAILKSLPIRDPETLVRLQRSSLENHASEMPYPFLQFYGEHSKTLQSVIGTVGGPPMQLDQEMQPLKNVFVTANYFRELGVEPALGRLVESGRDDLSGASPVVVLGYGFWQRRFSADPSIIGKTIRINQKPATVIGVLPYLFAGLEGQDADLWLPLAQHPYFVEGSTVLTDPSSGAGRVRMWGRLAPGVTAKAAAEELAALSKELRKIYPKEVWDREFLQVDPAAHLHVLHGDEYLVFAMTGVLTVLILAVACANLGGLLLARGVMREHEMQIRLAIGASGKRIFRQLFTESVFLAFLGAGAGLLLGWSIVHVTLKLTDAPPWMSAAPDWRVVTFTLAISLLTAIFFGFAPALQLARQRHRKALMRQLLVVAQIAASCVLLVVSGLLVRGVHRMLHSDPGFGYENLLSIDPGLGSHGYTAEGSRAYLEQFLARLRAVPGVTGVSLSSMPPLGHGRISTVGTQIAGRSVSIYPFSIGPDFFGTMRIPLLRGRNLFPDEKHAIIVGEGLARQQWPGEDPIGKQFWDNDTVVGIAGSARIIDIADDDALEVYHAAHVEDMPQMLVIVQIAGSPDTVLSQVRSISTNLDPKVLPYIRILKSEFNDRMKVGQRIALIVSLLGLVAVAIACIGIMGLVAYAVSQRLKEIAIRMALGAKRAQVIVAVLRQFMLPVVFGAVFGVGLAAVLSRMLRRVLFGLSNLDAVSYAAAVVVLLAILVVAALLPARRALLLDVAKVLHYE